MPEVTVVDYGIINLKNIRRGLEVIGAQVKTTLDPDDIIKADRIVLPGVGAFDDGMSELKKEGLDSALKDFVNTGRPLLGICLGMQLLFESSEEHSSSNPGLCVIPGTVEKIPSTENGRHVRKIPHIGWNALRYPVRSQSLNKSCLDETPEGAYFYFAHSFVVKPLHTDHILAECEYEGYLITAAVSKENIFGLQFHPEKSGTSGLNILKTFSTI